MVKYSPLLYCRIVNDYSTPQFPVSMSQTKATPLEDRSNLLLTAESTPKPTTRYSLYPKSNSSETNSEPHSSIYNASVCTSLEEVEKEPSGASKPVQSTRPRRFRRKLGRAEPRVKPPNSPVAPKSKPSIIEVRFSNRPNGTPLSTILEQKSSLSLRRRLSKISSKRSFTPIHVDPDSNYLHTTAAPVAVDAERQRVSLSLDEGAIREFQRIFSGSSEEVRANDGEDVAKPKVPPAPPHERTRTPPKTPRWPGDLTRDDIIESTDRRSFRSNRVVRAVRSFFEVPGAQGLLPSTAAQRHRTGTQQQRVGSAFWRPPRSAHFTSGYESISRHPFYNAPVLRPTTAGGSQMGEIRPRTSSKARWPSITNQEPIQCISNATERPADTVQMRLSAVVPTAAGQVLSPVPEDCDDQPVLDSAAASLSPRDDSVGRYTADGIPVYGPETASLRSVESDATPMSTHDQQRHDSIVEQDDMSRIPTQDGEEAFVLEPHVRWKEPAIQTRHRRRRGSGGSGSTISSHSQRRAPRLPQLEPCTTQIDGPSQVNEEAHVRHITSAALPILLPIAVREGIIQPVHLQPHSVARQSRRFHSMQGSRGSRSNGGSTELPSAIAPVERLLGTGTANSARPGPRMQPSEQIRCPHVAPEALATHGNEYNIGRLSVSVKQGDRCWKCKIERGIKWMIRQCLCHPEEDLDDEAVRVVQLERVPA